MRWMVKLVWTLNISILVTLLWVAAPVCAAEEYPPGWLPVNKLDDAPTWKEFRAIDDRVHLYLPNAAEPVRGVFVCYVFHSSDPRELARLWNFALVTIPWPFEYDLGVNDKRNGRYKAGHTSQDMGLLLRYLDAAAKETNHPELATVPLIGWLGQNGSHLCADLYKRAPERVLAWSDSFPNRLRQFPELTAAVPFPFAWEISKAELKGLQRVAKDNEAPLQDLSCRANTYGFEHGIYSKYNFFAAYLDRCIKLRLPEVMPEPGQPVKLKPVVRDAGWVGDFDPISEWNPIARAESQDSKSFKYPVWLPDEYAAWMWRSYHSANPGVKLTGPIVEYSKHDGKWGGPRCGLGYGGYLSSSDGVSFSAAAPGDIAAVEFFTGNKPLGKAISAPWQIEDVKLEPGLHALIAVGLKKDGTKVCSRPAFVIMK
jgi:hypothetical protein